MSAWSWTSAYRCPDRVLLTPEISILSELFSFSTREKPLLFHPSPALLPLMGSHPVSLCRFDSLSRRPHGPAGTGILLARGPSASVVVLGQLPPAAIFDLLHCDLICLTTLRASPFPLLYSFCFTNTPSRPDLFLFYHSSCLLYTSDAADEMD